MKRLLLATPILAALALPVAGGPPKGGPRAGGVGPEFLPANRKAPSAEPISDEEFEARRSKNSDGFGAAKLGRPERKTFDLVTMSAVLRRGENYTFVPKTAVIHKGTGSDRYVGGGTEGRFSVWPEFLAANRGWLSTHEITLQQAKGVEPISEETREVLRKRGGVVIATLQGNPISVAEYKPEKDPAVAASEAPAEPAR